LKIDLMSVLLKRDALIYLEAVLKPPLEFKVKAGPGGQPQQYLSILRIEHLAPTKDLSLRGNFNTAS
jgi:hypothetical protein